MHIYISKSILMRVKSCLLLEMKGITSNHRQMIFDCSWVYLMGDHLYINTKKDCVIIGPNNSWTNNFRTILQQIVRRQH